MSEAKDGGSAFPQHGWSSNPVVREEMKHQGGMSLRDWFAGQAMAHMVNSICFPQSVEDQLHKAGVKTEDFEAWTAHVAYTFADAMLAERAKANNERE